jgi:hypothetical protein
MIQSGVFRVFAGDQVVLRITPMFQNAENLSQTITVQIAHNIVQHNPYHRRLDQLERAIDTLSVAQQRVFVLDCAQRAFVQHAAWLIGRPGLEPTLLLQALRLLEEQLSYMTPDEFDELEYAVEEFSWDVNDELYSYKARTASAVFAVADAVHHSLNPTTDLAYEAATHALLAHAEEKPMYLYAAKLDRTDLDAAAVYEMQTSELEEWQRQMAVIKFLRDKTSGLPSQI